VRGTLRALAADHTINYKATPEWSSEVLRLTGGEGVSHVVEISGPGTLPQSIRATRVGGHIALIGVLTGLEGQVPTVELMRKQIHLQGLIVGSRAISRIISQRLKRPASVPSSTAPLPSGSCLSRSHIG
jgi:NADPH:quinone reductase-like Zn-dependent oxidoreductase